MKKIVYVITINYNSASHTKEMVKSVLESNYENLKIIVVDNASNHEDYKKLEELKYLNKNIIIIRSNTNLGFSGGNNIGLKKSIEDGATYAMLLNNDTTINKDTISKMVEYIENSKADVVCPKIVNYYNHNLINYAGGDLNSYKGAVKIYGIGKEDKGQFDEEKNITFAHGCCVLASLETWKKVGLMDEKYFLYFEDTALSAKFNREKLKMKYIPNAIVYHKESISTRKFSDNYQYYFCRNRLLYISENIKFPIKIVSYFYTSMYILKHILKRDFLWSNVSEAIISFINGNFGMRKVKNKNE